MVPGNTAATITSITTSLMPLFQVYTTATAAVALHYDFDGKVLIPPNSACWVTNNAASGGTFDFSLFWEETPL
jgi:hypothetical protein